MNTIVDHALAGTDDINTLWGQILWQPSDGTEGKCWYFIVVTSEKGRGFRCDRINVPADERDEFRAVLFMVLIQRRTLIVHDCDDELYMARL